MNGWQKWVIGALTTLLILGVGWSFNLFFGDVYREIDNHIEQYHGR